MKKIVCIFIATEFVKTCDEFVIGSPTFPWKWELTSLWESITQLWEKSNCLEIVNLACSKTWWYFCVLLFIYPGIIFAEKMTLVKKCSSFNQGKFRYGFMFICLINRKLSLSKRSLSLFFQISWITTKTKTSF